MTFKDFLMVLFVKIPVAILRFIPTLIVVLIFIGNGLNIIIAWAWSLVLRFLIYLLSEAFILNQNNYIVGKMRGFLKLMTDALLNRIKDL